MIVIDPAYKPARNGSRPFRVVAPNEDGDDRVVATFATYRAAVRRAVEHSERETDGQVRVERDGCCLVAFVDGRPDPAFWG